MSEFATKTIFPFEPNVEVAVDATGVRHKTVGSFQEQLGDLARLSYVRGFARYACELSGASSAGEATITLTDGNSVAYQATIDLSSATKFAALEEVDLTGYNGGGKLYWTLNVGTAADASVTAKFAGQLIVESPLIIGTC